MTKAVRSNKSSQQGFSLPEALIAALLLSTSILGLLNYYQSLAHGFMRQWQVQQAWAEAHSQLESYAATGKGTERREKSWEYQLSEVFATQTCALVSVIVHSPAKYRARLQRLYCEQNL